MLDSEASLACALLADAELAERIAVSNLVVECPVIHRSDVSQFFCSAVHCHRLSAMLLEAAEPVRVDGSEGGGCVELLHLSGGDVVEHTRGGGCARLAEFADVGVELLGG